MQTQRDTPPLRSFLSLWLLLTGLAAAPAIATADLKIPGCGELEQLALELDTNDRVAINRYREDLTLTRILAGSEFQQLFGKPLLQWSQGDAAGFRKAIQVCYQNAARSKRGEMLKPLANLRASVLYHMNNPRNAVERGRERVPEYLAQLKASTADTNKLKSYALLLKMRTLDQASAVNGALIPLQRMRSAAASAAYRIGYEIYQLPQAEADAVFETLAEQFRQANEAAGRYLTGQFLALPGTVPALMQNEKLLASLLADLEGVVSEDFLVSMKKASVQARQRITHALEQHITDTPASLEGAQSLNALLNELHRAPIDPETKIPLEQTVRTRLKGISQELLKLPLQKYQHFPQDLEGLKQLVSYHRSTYRNLSAQFDAHSLSALEQTYRRTHVQRMQAAQGELERFLAGLPVAETSLSQIRGLLEATAAPPDSEFSILATERGTQIALELAANQRKAQCKKALPNFDLEASDEDQLILGARGDTSPLKEFTCDLALAGNQVHEYASSGFFSQDHTLTVTGRDGIYRSYVLHSAEVGPGIQALVGVRVTDPTHTTELGISDWQMAVATLLPESPSGRNSRCRAIMNTPENRLTPQDRIDAMGCLMSSLLGKQEANRTNVNNRGRRQ